MRYIEPARDTKNAVLHVGTNAVFRRKYIDEVGGYPTKSITEDMALGLMLQAHGYDSIYINEQLVCGLSASTYKELVKQRDRWSRGNLQVLKNYKKIIRKQLCLKQKLIYIDGAIYWLSGLAKLIYIITPIIYMLTGMVIVNVPPVYLLPLFITAFSSQILVSKLILPNKISSKYLRFFLTGELYSTIMAPHMALSVFKYFFSSSRKFSVTSKQTDNKSRYDLKYSIVHIILLLFSNMAIIVGTLNLEKNIHYQPYFINLFWILYNIPFLVLSIKMALQTQRNIFDECIPVSTDNTATININEKIFNTSIKSISENYIQLEKPFELVDNLNIGNTTNIVLGATTYICLIEKITPDTIGLKFNEKMSEKQLTQISKIIVKNLKPYMNNLT